MLQRSHVIATWLLIFSLPASAQQSDEAKLKEKAVNCQVEDLAGKREPASVDFKLIVGDDSKAAFDDKSVSLPDGTQIDLSIAPMATLKAASGADVQTYSGYIRIVQPGDQNFKDKYVHMTLVGGAEFAMTWAPLKLGIRCHEL